MTHQYPRAPFIPIYRSPLKRCPKCAHADNCSVSRDGARLYCRRVSSPMQGRDGGWLHFLDGSDVQAVPSSHHRRFEPASTLAPVEHLHAVYSALLSRLPLLSRHFDNLVARGLDDTIITSNGYRSTPNREESDALAASLSPLGLAGVPGFFFARDAWRLVWTRPGLFVPYRDSRGRILALSYRVDEPGSGGKYLWLSTDPNATLKDGRQKYARGSKTRPPVHVAGRHLLRGAREIMLTEGALKADVASHLLGLPALASGGVTQWGQGFAPRFKASFPAASAAVCFDADWRQKREVKHALESLCASLSAAGVAYFVRSWPNHPDAKGIDDLALQLSRESEVRAA